MKTKIIKTIAALMLSLLSLPMMGQDFMEVYFKDGIYKKFYLEGLKEWKVSQYDSDGVKHADYNYQHIKTNTHDFVFELEKIDSIVFTKFDEEKAKQDFDAAMTSVLSVLSENITAEEVEMKLDFIKNSESVEDAWCSGHVLFVDVRNCGTINFYLYEDIVDDEETEDDINLANQMKAYIPQFKQMLSQNGRTPSIVVANQNHYDLSRTNRLKVYEKILDEFGQCGFDTTYLARPTIDFFATEMYNYDLILFISHGCYNDETKNHSFITGELLGSEIPISKNSDASEELIDECRKRFRELNETAKYRGIETVKISFQLEEGESGNVLRGYPSISEDFFGEGGTSQGSFRLNSIFFNGCCQMFNGTTTETATSFADKFVKVHGLRLFLGYKFDNHYSPWAGSYFFRSMLCGKSTESAFNEVESKYKSKEKFLTGAELLFRRNDNDNGIFFITPTITSETDSETVKSDYYNSKVVSVKGYTTSLDLADIKCGFLYSTNKDFSSAINVIDNAPVKVSKPFADGRGNVVFRYDIKDLQPGNTYHYCAYTYDGKHYNYGNALSFYVPFELQLSTQDLSLIADSTTTVEITSGNGDYTVSVDKPNIATATLSGTTITIKGEAKGTAKVTVKDKSGQTAEINVKVWDNLTLSQSSVGLYPGNSTTVEITNGSGHYTVSVDKPAIATASLSGSVITIKGVGVGSAVVTVTDTSTNQTAKINVTVSSAPTLVVSNSSVELMVGGSSIVEITSGSGSYEISNSNTRVVQAVLEGAKITLTAKSEGNAVVTVKDKVTGQTASISVTVNSIANLVLSQSNVNLAIGAEAIVEIVSGSGDYSVAVDKPAVATATLSGTKITIKGIATGTANVTVKDKSGQTAEITVSVYTKDELIIPLSVVDLTIGAETTVEIVLGSGDYSVAVDDSDIATASISGSIIKIYGVGVGTTIVTVTDNVTNQKKGIFVNVSLSYVPANAIDLGLPSGTKWASWNVGASAPGDCGGYYAWGETETKEYYGWDTYEYFNNETFEFQYIGDDIAGTEYDVAHVKWGGGWRMPTDNQMYELYHCCTWTWTSMWSTNGYSHTGFLVTGPNGNSIFLPAAGYCLGDDPTPYDLCSKGHYWSSEMSTNYEYIMYDSVLSYFFYYNDNNWSSYYYGESNRYYGLSVRPVCP